MAEHLVREWVVLGVNAAAFTPLLSSLPLPWLYAERMETIVLCWLKEAQSQAIPWNQWRHGRAFGPEGELAWWKNNTGGYDLRWLGETMTPPPEGIAWQEIGEWKAIADPVATLLHGDNGDGSSPRWGEARIPFYQHYPVALTEAGIPARVSLLTQHYQGEGVARLVRLLAVLGVTGEGHE